MRLVTPNEAAYVLSCRPTSVYKWMEEGKLPYICVAKGGKRLVALAEYLRKHDIDPQPYFDYLDAKREKFLAGLAAQHNEEVAEEV